MRRKNNSKKNIIGVVSKFFKKNNDSTNILEKLILGVIAFIITFFIVSMVSGAYALTKIGSRSMPSSIDPASNEPVNILLIGTDIGNVNQVDNQTDKRTDTIMVLNYNPQNKNLHIVSIPRDTLINVNGKNVKINSAYEIGGYSKIKSEVENLLDININYMVKIDYTAFDEIIDAIGGVDMKIDRNMIYDDPVQNLHINFKAGETVNLDGKKAEEFFRWRENNDGSGFANGDLDRIENQHKFISKVIEKCTSPLMIFRVPKIMSAVGDNVETNMSSVDVLSYGMKFMGLKQENVTMSTIKGTEKTINGESFVVFDKNANKEILAPLTSSSNSKSLISSTSKGDIRIKILNATKINGLAAKVMKQLSNDGYTKIDTGNIELSDKSRILANDSDKSNTIKQDLNIKDIEKKENKPEYNDYDVIIILGKDYEEFGK
ncbi:cell envelope-related transcriptional attenuator [Clostridium sp. DL-VIII]|uniref:LCP family protein n=1 Tax=Clostridium sp. DL-VIII TaxID=641107 RepID=UPI00023B0586|nr:LCP family protein [Clostridium sp. DL-VIII]EHJ02000.1 cell envelope-related transcriptional attenuator [Clostridium sp. DL-VIII]